MECPSNLGMCKGQDTDLKIKIKRKAELVVQTEEIKIIRKAGNEMAELKLQFFFFFADGHCTSHLDMLLVHCATYFGLGLDMMCF